MDIAKERHQHVVKELGELKESMNKVFEELKKINDREAGPKVLIKQDPSAPRPRGVL